MPKEVVLLAVHGMGRTERNFADDLESKLRKELGDNWSKVRFKRVCYQGVLQRNQERVFNAMSQERIDWLKLREFLLYGFSDAAGLERNPLDNKNPYYKTQEIILGTLDDVFSYPDDDGLPLVVIAQSLGGQLISNYIWDAQKKTRGRKEDRGVFGENSEISSPVSDPHDDFRRMKTLKFFFTTGCNIPVFVAGFPRGQIEPISTNYGGWSFKWKNYYDEDDALGWPLRPLNRDYSRAIAVDQQVNADGGFFGKLIRGWNPFSHGGYWTDKNVIKPLAADISSLFK